MLLTGGEEVGTWLRQLDAASNVGFAFALELGDAPARGAIGELRWNHERSEETTAELPPPADLAGDLRALFHAVRHRQGLRCASPAGGEIEAVWF